MKDKNLFPFVAVICLILIAVIGLIVKDKKLDPNSELITNLYSYLGEIDTYHCGGLKSYSDSTITIDSLNEDDLLCMAYYSLSEDSINLSETPITEKNEYSQNICKVGEGINILAEEESDTCTYNIVSKDALNEEFKKMYGNEIKNYNSFYISSSERCNLEEDVYYCGNSETYNYSLGADATIYRLLSKALKRTNGEIVIYDYFLKVSDNVCYKTTKNDNENADCTINLEDNLIDEEFVQKYGTLYKHTYKKDSNNNYYWYKSEMR